MTTTSATCETSATSATSAASATSATSAAFYDRVWNEWGHLDDRSPAAFHRRRVLLGLVRRHAEHSRRVLEVGCGQGALLAQLTFALPAATIHGSDVSEQSLVRARAHCPSAHLFLLDLESANFEEHAQNHLAYFDLILCSEVLEHLHDDRLALDHLARLLAPGGTLIISVPGGEPTRFDRAIGHLRHYSQRDLSQKLAIPAFCDQQVFAWGFPFHSFYRWVVKWAARAAFDSRASAPRTNPSLVSHAYAAFARVLNPLYYLNRVAMGPQLFAIARRT